MYFINRIRKEGVVNHSARSILVVHSKPVEGREAEYDHWYSEVHLPEVIALDGFVAARRFRFVPKDADDVTPDLPFLAIYEVEPGRLEEARTGLARALEESKAALAAGEQPILATSEALHADRLVHWYEEIASAGPR